ncbi:MFS transporter [Pseudomonas marginalis]|uniref:MFS transporter n=1 Tax=Pseudomonas marginalis TaxID=298 RepID=UPI003B9FBAE3
MGFSSLDRLQRRDLFLRKVLIVDSMGRCIKSFDLLMLGFMLPAISLSLGLTPVEAGSLATWALLGSVTGSLIFGSMQAGPVRMKALGGCILMFACFGGLCALAQGFWDLLIYRALAGFGLGGEYGIGMALITEALRARRLNEAPPHVGVATRAAWGIAVVISILLMIGMGWRGMFLVVLAVGLVLLMIRSAVMESYELPASTPVVWRFKAHLKGCVSHKSNCAVIAFTAAQYFGVSVIVVWMPSYLVNRLECSLLASGVWAAGTLLGIAAGIRFFGLLAERIGGAKALLVYTACGVGVAIAFANLRDPLAIMIVGGALAIFGIGLIGGCTARVCNNYVAQLRGTTPNVLFGLGHSVGGAGPLIVGGIIHGYSYYVAVTLFASACLIMMGVTVYLVVKQPISELGYGPR